jgi:pimeloyl-ACP methyl ester carboxylesterase
MSSSVAEAAGAVADLADDLRLRQIDLFGMQTGASVAMDLAAARPELVRRLVLVALPGGDPLATVKQSTLVMRARPESPDVMSRFRAALPNGKFVDIADFTNDMFDAAPKTLSKQIGAFLTDP